MEPGLSALAGPLLTITRGEPTPDELAALLVVLAGRAARPARYVGPARGQWSRSARLLRAPLRPGPGAWRASALPD